MDTVTLSGMDTEKPDQLAAASPSINISTRLNLRLHEKRNGHQKDCGSRGHWSFHPILSYGAGDTGIKGISELHSFDY